jgi:hypothetical protein
MTPHEMRVFGVVMRNDWEEEGPALTIPDAVPITTSGAPPTTSMLKLKLKLKLKGKLRAWLKVKVANGHVNATAKISSRRRG